MNNLPTLNKNAYLKIYLSADSLYAQLAYSHYDIGRSYILREEMPIDRDHDQDDLSDPLFWKEYFESLEKIFGWEMVNDYMQLIPLDSEGNGINGIKMIISDSGLDTSKILGAVREVSKDIQIVLSTPTSRKDTLIGISQRLGIKDVLHLDLNLREFRLSRVFEEGRRKNINDLSLDRFKWEEGSIQWRDPNALIEAARNAKLRAFLSSEVKEDVLMNAWSNFVFRSSRITTSELLLDIIRAYITVQLLTIRNDNKDMFKGLGESRDGVMLFITGDLLQILPEKNLILSLVDGLELEGVIDVVFDHNNSTEIWGQSYVEGPTSTDMVVHAQELWEQRERLYVLGISGRKKDKRAVYTVDVEGEKVVKEDYFALSGSITTIDLPKHISKLLVDSKFEQGAYIRDGDKKDSFVSDPSKIEVGKIFVDGRHKPVVYGPEPRKNLSKLNEWLDETD